LGCCRCNSNPDWGSDHRLSATLINFCLSIVLSGLASAGLPCSWLEVVDKSRLTRQLCVKIVLQPRCQFVIFKVEGEGLNLYLIKFIGINLIYIKPCMCGFLSCFSEVKCFNFQSWKSILLYRLQIEVSSWINFKL
jgi:hypothetical protein